MGKVRLDTALELSLYLSRETETMVVTQGFQELVPLYKLMEKRDMAALENKMKVRKEAGCGAENNHQTLRLCYCSFSGFRATSWICSGA